MVLRIKTTFLLFIYVHLHERIPKFQLHELILIHFGLNGDTSMVLLADDGVRRVTTCSRRTGRRAP
jgi:hypothetical protein